MGLETEWLGVFLFTRVETTVYPSRVSYSAKKLKKCTKKNEERDLAYIPAINYGFKEEACLKKLKELNFNLDYGLARDSMEYLKSRGLAWL